MSAQMGLRIEIEQEEGPVWSRKVANSPLDSWSEYYGSFR